MPTTRSVTRKGDSASPDASKASPRNKRKAEASPASSPAAKTKKTQAPKKQKTIEETLPDGPVPTQDKGEDVKDVEMKDDSTNEQADSKQAAEQSKVGNDVEESTSTVSGQHNEKSDGSNGTKSTSNDTSSNQQASVDAKDKTDSSTGAATSTTNGGFDSQKTMANGEAEVHKVEDKASHESNGVEKPAAKEETTSSSDKSDEAKPASFQPAKDTAIDESSEREKATPSSILEKGVIYFFFRGRVGIDDPSDVDDLARSYIVLHPLPRGAKLSDGPLGNSNNLRVLALPKKVLPKSPQDRFMMFVEKAKANLEDLKKEFLSASDYDTKTAGPRHTPAATPIGEGVYAITSTGRESHLAYVLTIPQTLNEVQKDIGLEAKGSWVTSVKNPQHKGPAQAQLPQDPEFPKEILDEFRTLRWGPLQPKHLDYENCQFLLIGHKEHSFAKATETDDKEADPKEEIEKLGEEDEQRVEHLKGDDTVFEDLNLDAKDYPSVQTTW